ncbi:hypothetical protein HJFPF1_03687 [Paramyrothecium foliicola]|nr:hypothetical protein HJFPF1_03687 [Paramyrothecium foliicola]
MSAPRTKRQFAGSAADPSQRQITSFFSSQRPAADNNSVATVGENLRQTSLPSNVQSNLLSVGMRVRKSVPEGYKTGTMSAFKLWSDNTPMPSPMSAGTPVRARSSTRELLPFCGINRVGGLDVQPEPQLNDGHIPPLDSLPELTMSQESTDSTFSTETSRKRFFDDDDAEEVDVPKQWDGQLSPRSLAPMGYRNTRVIAVPRSREAKSSTQADQENMVVDEDFDEAEFLVFTGHANMDTTG